MKSDGCRLKSWLLVLAAKPELIGPRNRPCEGAVEPVGRGAPPIATRGEGTAREGRRRGLDTMAQLLRRVGGEEPVASTRDPRRVAAAGRFPEAERTTPNEPDRSGRSRSRRCGRPSAGRLDRGDKGAPSWNSPGRRRSGWRPGFWRAHRRGGVRGIPRTAEPAEPDGGWSASRGCQRRVRHRAGPYALGGVDDAAVPGPASPGGTQSRRVVGVPLAPWSGPERRSPTRGLS
jgi:hypothetical protein